MRCLASRLITGLAKLGRRGGRGRRWHTRLRPLNADLGCSDSNNVAANLRRTRARARVRCSCFYCEHDAETFNRFALRTDKCVTDCRNHVCGTKPQRGKVDYQECLEDRDRVGAAHPVDGVIHLRPYRAAPLVKRKATARRWSPSCVMSKNGKLTR